MVYQYKILPHPADIRLEIRASSKEDLFAGALEGMAYILQPNIPQKGSLKKEQIEIHSLDINTLLVDFLSEVLAKSDIYNCIFDKIKIGELRDDSIKGVIQGRKVKEFSEEIKAVTYHKLNIFQDKKGIWKATILFDI